MTPLLKTIKKIFLNRKILIALFGVVLFFSLIPFAFAEAEHECRTEYDKAVAGGNPEIYFFDLTRYNPVDGWIRTDTSIENLASDAFTPSNENSCPDGECLYQKISSFKMENGATLTYEVEFKDEDGATICFKESAEDLRNAGDQEWNNRAVSIKILDSGDCENPGITQGGGLTFLEQWCPAGFFGSWTEYPKCILESLLSLPFSLPLLLIVITIGLIALGLGVLSSAVAALLSWVIYICLTVPIIKADVVEIGWAFSRDFVNMLFILILVIIGLATILRIESYGLKKTLPTLLGIALLVNFSLVLVGFVVDISNIVTNFFFNEIRDSSWNLLSKTAGDVWTSIETVIAIMGNFYENIGGTLSEAAGVIAYEIVLAIFYIGNIIVYLITAFLLFFRIIALWILAILAPIAFFCYILEKTRPVWDMWWKNLLQWSIIGIPLGFFLYLSSYIMSKEPVLQGEDYFCTTTLYTAARDGLGGTTLSEVLTTNFSNLIVGLLAPVVSLVFLAMGILIAMKMAPAGADLIMKGAKVAGSWAMRRQPVRALAGKALGGANWALGGAEKLAGKIPGAKWAERYMMKGKTPIGKALRGAVVSPLLAPKGIARGSRLATEWWTTPTVAKLRKTPMPQNWDIMSSEERQKAIGLAIGSDKLNLAHEAWKDHQDIKHMPEVLEALPLLNEKYSGNPNFAMQTGDLSDYYLKAVTKDSELAYAEATEGQEGKNELEKKINTAKESVIAPEIEKLGKTEGGEEKIIKRIAWKYDIDEDTVRKETDKRKKELKEQLVEDEAAAYVHAKGFDTSDWRNAHKSFANSFGAQMAADEADSSVIRTIRENFEPSVYEKVFNEALGIGGRFETAEKIAKAKKEDPEEAKLAVAVRLFSKNESSIRWFIENPTGKNIHIKELRETIKNPKHGGGLEGFAKAFENADEAKSKDKLEPGLEQNIFDILSEIKDKEQKIKDKIEKEAAGEEAKGELKTVEELIKEIEGLKAELKTKKGEEEKEIKRKIKELEKIREVKI